jgi:hypothetical protein
VVVEKVHRVANSFVLKVCLFRSSGLKGYYHEMVCQLRPLVYSFWLNNPPHVCLTPRKSRIKNLWRNKQGSCRCKMAGAGIRSFAKFRGQMPRIDTTGITSWQTALKWTADCQVPRSCCCGQVKPVAIRSQINWYLSGPHQPVIMKWNFGVTNISSLLEYDLYAIRADCLYTTP